MRRMRSLAAALITLTLLAQAQPADLPSPDPVAIGVEAATTAYLDTIPAEKRARSDAYFEGGYWLTLWDFLWSSLGLLVLLNTGLSARMRDFATRRTRSVFVQPAIYWIGFSLFVFLFSLPLAVY